MNTAHRHAISFPDYELIPCGWPVKSPTEKCMTFSMDIHHGRGYHQAVKIDTERGS
jgi:hypothetical protein